MSTRGGRKNLPRPPGQNLNFDASHVIAVREEDDGRSSEFISQPFDFRVRYQSPGLVLFHIAVSLADSVATKTTVYLQITADQIHSLKKSNHDTTDTNSPNPPPFLENVRRQLNGVRLVTRLQFRLYGCQRAKFIVPRSFTTENVSEDPAFEAAESLAVVSLFSLYLRHDILPRAHFGAYLGAIRQFPDLATREQATYEAMIHASRLYHGDGGKEHTPRDYHCRSRSTRDRDSPSAPGTPSSCGSGSTLPFDDVPQYRAPPPPYGERVAESQCPRARLDVADIVAAGLGGDRDLPEYGATNRRDDVQDPLPVVLSCGEGDGDVRSTSKRKRSSTVLHATTTYAAYAPRHEKLLRTVFVDANDDSQVTSLHASEQQQPRVRGEHSEGLQNTVEQLRKTVRELQKEVEELQAWKKTHTEAFGDVEGTCCQLAERQEDFDDAVGTLYQDVDELGGKHDELGKQLLDVGDEVRDMMDDMKRTAQEEICETIDDSVAKKVEEIVESIVESQVNEIKRKICKALQPI
ncbi:hypothetical protein CABS02_15422 [Colletotrichum abscissum]|uniref:Uncharacterized protein n=1 Tax=Colletotrichum abscissum TaxID=1671311 RepID=A0A9P9WZV6_9PEZI|nr:hypothetical protein CABS02_15422 [Colletotrichum abscissum]